MPSFLAGALGALTVLVTAGVARTLAWRRFHRHGRGRSRLAAHLARRIGARPEQERVIAAEADALATELRALRADAGALRAELADLLVAPTLDADRARAALEARLARVSEVKSSLAGTIARVHAALDPEQRARLAALVRSGPHHRHHGHAHG